MTLTNLDCIRTYTWDKKMETMVKGAIGNSASKRPTVITPKEYKARFREAMERYILEAPKYVLQYEYPIHC